MRSSLSSHLFDKLVFAGDSGRLRFSFKNSIRNRGCIQLDCADRVIIARNHIINPIGITVSINNAHHWNAQLVGFIDGNALVIHINNKQNIRQTIHILDTANAVLKLVLHARAHQNFFLGQLFEGAIGFLSFKLTETTDRSTNSFVVSEHAAQPAMADIGHSAALCLLFNNFLCSTLGANKKNLITFSSLNTQNL